MFNRTKRLLLAITLMAHAAPLAAISIVYNFRIAQVTKQPIFPENRHHTVIALPFEQYQKKYTGVNQNFAGGLASYICDIAHYYFRVDGAFANIQTWGADTAPFSATTTDDLLFTVGRNFKSERHHTRYTLSGLFGVPTHKVHALQHTDFGYGQVGLGTQLDGLYEFNQISSFIYGARYIYFLPRTALDPSCEKHRFTIGSDADVLVAFKNSWRHHGFEIGYSARFDFGAHCCPLFDDIDQKTDYIRSNLYAVYKYKWRIRGIPNRFLLNFSYGRDHMPKAYGNEYILTVWAAWNVNF